MRAIESCRLYGLIATSPRSATRNESNGAARVAMLYGRSSTDSLRIWRGPKRAPVRFDVPRSNGTPTKHASKPAAEPTLGSRIMVAIPPQRGIALPDKGCGRSLASGEMKDEAFIVARQLKNAARENVRTGLSTA